ncbi:MAG TPA: deoxyribodipyrimidine photo-lyase [Polyangiaceae bacterium]|nr:deoxyribodipyrimidine photo-lyase [Polyangiaceae bacterium]
MRTLVWYRGKDLRVSDHAPLHQAARDGEAIPVFVVDPYFFAPERAQRLPHRIEFLLESLRSLEQNLAQRGSRLLVVAGKSVDVIPALADALRVDRVFAHRWVEPFARERDRRVKAALGDRFTLFEGETLVTPGTVRTGGGSPFSVFTPFARAVRRELGASAPLAAPRALPPLPPLPKGLALVPVPSLESLGIASNPRILRGGEKSARARLKAFLAGPAARYDADRDRMDKDGTSRLSADLKFGTLSIKAVWHAAIEAKASGALPADAVDKLTSELLWREFSHHTLWDRPELLERPFRADFEGFPYVDDERGWTAWATGQTGYPVVDAAQRQLLGEGYVHNRARMITASFLTKHLLVSYRRGEAHFMQWLTDGDWAQNDAGWQWSAGSGCDAQPYFRVFNPVSQGERFDPSGDYVRAWVPELARLPAEHIHAPWLAPPLVLREAGVRLGETYPAPIVDHAFARARFLETAKAHLAKSKA